VDRDQVIGAFLEQNDVFIIWQNDVHKVRVIGVIEFTQGNLQIYVHFEDNVSGEGVVNLGFVFANRDEANSKLASLRT
jgi:hypothetical protein